MFEHVWNISEKLSSCLWERMRCLGTGSKGDLFFMIYPLYLWNFVLHVYILVEKVAEKAKKKKKKVTSCVPKTPHSILEQKPGSKRDGETEKGWGLRMSINISWLLKRKLLLFLGCIQLSCDPMDCSPSGFSAHGILRARILGWVAIPFSRGSSWPRDQTHVSCVSWTDGWILLLLSHQGRPPKWNIIRLKKKVKTQVCLYRVDQIDRSGFL